MGWYPCCCADSRNHVYVPCCFQGVSAVITAYSVNGAGIRPNTIILSLPAVPGMVSSNHGGVMVFDVSPARYQAGSTWWYFWGLEPIDHDKVFNPQVPANWRLQLGFKNIADIGVADQLVINDVHLELGFWQGTDEAETAILYPTAVSGSWTGLSSLIGGTGEATSPDLNFCADEETIYFDFGPVQIADVTHVIHSAKKNYLSFLVPSKLPPHSNVRLCFKDLEPTTDPVNSVSPVDIVDCNDPTCVTPECDCQGARPGFENTCDGCACHGALPIKIGGYGNVFPERPMYVWTDFGNTQQWTVYGYAKRRNNPAIGMLFWSGNECRAISSFNFGVQLWRSGTGIEEWVLEVQDSGPPIHTVSKSITAGTTDDVWFFFSIRKRKRAATESFAGEPPGGWEYTFQIDHANNRADPLIVYQDYHADYTILGETGFGDTFTFAGPEANNQSIAGCLSGLTFTSVSLPHWYLDLMIDLPCDTIPS